MTLWRIIPGLGNNVLPEWRTLSYCHRLTDNGKPKIAKRRCA